MRGHVVEILKSTNPDIEVQGIGGDNLKNAGATLFFDHTKMSAFGFNFKMAIEHLQLEKKYQNIFLMSLSPI